MPFLFGGQIAPATPASVSIPSYTVATLPWAAANQNSLIIVMDDPQGLARSIPVGGTWHWLSEVDGSDLGEGNAANP